MLIVLFQAVYQGQEVSFVELFIVMCDRNTQVFELFCVDFKKGRVGGV